MNAWLFQNGLTCDNSEIIAFETSRSCVRDISEQRRLGATPHPASMQQRVESGADSGTWFELSAHNINRVCRMLRLLLGIIVFYFGGVVVNPGIGSARAQGLPVYQGISGVRGEPSQSFHQSLEKPGNISTGAPPENQGGESHIGSDDLLDITVFEAPEMDRTLRVSATGEISLQLLGAVRAAGLTPRELELVLQELLRHTYMKDPHVGVFVRELQSHPVSVVGAVKMPGVFQIRNTKTVLELLSMAQGLADDAGDMLVIMRGASFLKSASTEGPGIVKSERGAISPEGKGLGTDDFTSVPAQGDKGEIVEVNLKRLLESADPALNLPVHPGDIVKVSRAGIVYVLGNVNKPGGFVLKSNENISVIQALALAEGLTRTSSKSQARIIRTDQETDKRLEIPVDLGKILNSKAPDPVLQPKDIIFVPDSSAKSAFYRGAEAVLSTATGVVIYRR